MDDSANLETLWRSLLDADAIRWDGSNYVVGPYNDDWYSALTASRRLALLAAADAVAASRARLVNMLRETLGGSFERGPRIETEPAEIEALARNDPASEFPWDSEPRTALPESSW
jgi:hypothetical protein